MDIEKFVDELAEEALRNGPIIQPAEPSPERLDRILKGCAVELWSTTSGRLFLVADEADARQTMERFGPRRGEIYTAAEVQRIIAVDDAAVVTEIHDWKRGFDAVVQEFRDGGRPK
jgi:hypothetical protein